MANASVDRLRAARLLLRVDAGAFAARLLGETAAAGVRARVLGVLRHRRRLDAVLSTALRDPLAKLEAEVLVTLRIGVFEIAVLGVPAPVAGDGAVHLVRKLGKGRASGLVNAVMRRAPRGWGRLDASRDLGLRYSHPEWLTRRWIDAWGRDATEASLRSSQEPAPVWVWFRDQRAREAVCDEGVDLDEHPWVPGAWRSTGSRLLPAVERGLAYAQDPASQLIAKLAVEVSDQAATLLDLCAAPGGKAARAAVFGSWSRIVACDRHVGRLRLAKNLFRTCRAEVSCAAQDGIRPAVREKHWDVVLLDAPCTGTGTLRRHPELRWRLEAAQLAELAARQQSLLEQACLLVVAGGVLLYSTCSVEPEENEHHFSRLPSGFEPIELSRLLAEDAPVMQTPAGGVLLRPHELWDGFTIHAVRRVR